MPPKQLLQTSPSSLHSSCVCSDRVHESRKLWRQWAFDEEQLILRWRRESKSVCMQEEAAKSRQTGNSSRCSVHSVPDNRMANARKVYPDLMRAACLDSYFEKAEVRPCFDHAVFGKCIAAKP